MAKHFGSAAAFKASLEAHLRTRAGERGVPVGTLQLKFAIERLLARLFRDADPGWLLKGGFSLDLRFRPRARTTTDIDLAVALDAGGNRPAAVSEIRDRLQAAAAADLGDYLAYRIARPKRELTTAPGGGARFPCDAALAGKTYAKFHLDIGLGDAVTGEPDPLTGDDLLDFAGIAPARVLAIPTPQQFAEKVHAYTFPWAGRRNTRTKDLVDLVLLIERSGLDAASVRRAVVATFDARRTHARPRDLAPPPPEWEAEFVPMATEADLTTLDYLTAFAVVRRFWLAHRLGDEPMA